MMSVFRGHLLSDFFDRTIVSRLTFQIMSLSSHRVAVAVVVSLALAGSAIAFAAAGDDPVTTSKSALTHKRATGDAKAAIHNTESLTGFDPRVFRRENGLLVSDLETGHRAVLSLDSGLQEHLSRLFERYQVPYGAAVAIEPQSGRLLSYVSHSSAEQETDDLVLDATAPAASVFKIITAAALIDARVDPQERVCYNGGFRRLTESDLIDNPRRDAYCATFQEAMGRSINAVFAKLADRHLNAGAVERYASAFGFGHALPFDVRPSISRAQIPTDRLEFARTAAGFWHTQMSPLHGALIAATIANDGVMPRLSMIDRVVDGSGKVIHRFQRGAFRSVIPRRTARTIGRMMQQTVTHGTAKNAFFDPKGQAFLPGIPIAGKTGSLSQSNPYRAYSWWIGYAPLDNPTISVAVLVVNTPRWRIKASYAAREALRYYLVMKPKKAAKND